MLPTPCFVKIIVPLFPWIKVTKNGANAEIFKKRPKVNNCENSPNLVTLIGCKNAKKDEKLSGAKLGNLSTRYGSRAGLPDGIFSNKKIQFG
jgi:hypothetical protein